MERPPSSGVAASRSGNPGGGLLVVGANGVRASEAVEGLGFGVAFVRDLGDAVRSILAAPPAAVLLYADDSSAASACEVLRALGSFSIAVCPRPLATEVATACLDQGADLVLTHDVSSDELAQRMATLLQAGNGRSQSVVTGDLAIDLGAQTVLRDGEPLALSPTEFQVLAVLARRFDQVVPARDILREVWGDEFIDDIHYVRLYIGYLRQKVERDPLRPRMIITHRGAGYRLAAQPLPLATREKAG